MNPVLDEMFYKVPRANFLPTEHTVDTGLDVPVPIGFGQTNSQPSTVYQMLEWLDVREGQTVLDVGSGSGWTTALLANLAGPHGRVVAVEKIPQLVRFGRENVERLGITNATFHKAKKGLVGWEDQAPYERILVSASANTLPSQLVKQLGRGGRMVIPVRNTILVIDKDAAGDVDRFEYPGFVFVPLVS
ncbi:MAG TPA: methyltransferase domain-containing protein [Candidatus Saccharimonadales bacterium]|nr:methyltransferase domain-containing protein [Candidatus Saccharimonadales bacterium]